MGWSSIIKISMKKIFLLTSLLLISLFLKAQLGLTGGLNLASMSRGIGSPELKNVSKIGFQAGLFYDFTLSEKIKFQPSLLLLNESYKQLIPISDKQDSEYKESTNSYSCFIPLVFSYKIPTKPDQSFLIDLGLFSSIGLWGNFDRTIDTTDKGENLYTDNRKLVDFGIITGLGYDTRSLNYSLRLKYGLRELTYFNYKSTTFLLSIGYKLR